MDNNNQKNIPRVSRRQFMKGAAAIAAGAAVTGNYTLTSDKKTAVIEEFLADAERYPMLNYFTNGKEGRVDYASNEDGVPRKSGGSLVIPITFIAHKTLTEKAVDAYETLKNEGVREVFQNKNGRDPFVIVRVPGDKPITLETTQSLTTKMQSGNDEIIPATNPIWIYSKQAMECGEPLTVRFVPGQNLLNTNYIFIDRNIIFDLTNQPKENVVQFLLAEIINQRLTDSTRNITIRLPQEALEQLGKAAMQGVLNKLIDVTSYDGANLSFGLKFETDTQKQPPLRLEMGASKEDAKQKIGSWLQGIGAEAAQGSKFQEKLQSERNLPPSNNREK